MTSEEFIKLLEKTGDEAYKNAALGSGHVDHEQLFIYRCCQIGVGAMNGFMAELKLRGLSEDES